MFMHLSLYFESEFVPIAPTPHTLKFKHYRHIWITGRLHENLMQVHLGEFPVSSKQRCCHILQLVRFCYPHEADM